MTQMDLFAAKQKRDEGIKNVSSHNHGFISLMQHAAREICKRQGSVSSDDLRIYAAARGLRPDHPNAWGCILRGSDWIQVGWKKSQIISNHARSIRIWQVKGEDEK